MQQEQIDDLLEWSDREGTQEFSDFVREMYCVYNNKKVVRVQCGEKTEQGRLLRFHVLYNKKFVDLDVDLRLEGYSYTHVFSEITKEQIVKEEGRYHIIITEEGLEDGYVSVVSF